MYDALIVALTVFIGVAGYEVFRISMLSRPIVAAPLIGALMGDSQTGLIAGVSLEAIFMGVASIRIPSTAELSLVAGLATAFAVKMGGNMDAIIPVVFPLAVLELQLMNMILSFVYRPMTVKFSKFVKSGDQKGIINLHLFMWFVRHVLYALVPFFAVLFGADVVKSVLNNIPEVITNGLAVVGNLLPTVGMAMLLRILWSKNIAVWLFSGAVVMAHLRLPLITIAAVGAIIVIVIARRDLQLENILVHTVQSDAIISATLDQEEEDFS